MARGNKQALIKTQSSGGVLGGLFVKEATPDAATREATKALANFGWMPKLLRIAEEFWWRNDSCIVAVVARALQTVCDVMVEEFLIKGWNVTTCHKASKYISHRLFNPSKRRCIDSLWFFVIEYN
jgi:predicted ArsR family transcriptional regulator